MKTVVYLSCAALIALVALPRAGRGRHRGRPRTRDQALPWSPAVAAAMGRLDSSVPGDPPGD